MNSGSRVISWCYALIVVFVTSFCAAPSFAVKLTGRASGLVSLSRYEYADELGHEQDKTVNAGQQSLRLMLEDFDDSSEWSVHIKTYHQHTDNVSLNSLVTPESPFRYRQVREDWDSNENTFIGYDLDRLYYKKQFGQAAVSIGRQAIDWGSGRFWQPMNVFGAFAPTDLDTDYKQGIDGIHMQYFPSVFSSLSFAYVFAPQNNLELASALKNSYAVRYRGQVGENSEMAFLFGDVLDNTVVAGSYESDWQGLGWRVEGAYYIRDKPKEVGNDTDILYWIAGIDYQFNNGALCTLEWYSNEFGVTDSADILINSSDLAPNPALLQAGKHALGASVSHDISPLMNLHYLALLGGMKHQGDREYSVLHQLNLVYSVSNNSDLLFSIMLPQGKGLTDTNQISSDFGHLPLQALLRIRLYF